MWDYRLLMKGSFRWSWSCKFRTLLKLKLDSLADLISSSGIKIPCLNKDPQTHRGRSSVSRCGDRAGKINHVTKLTKKITILMIVMSWSLVNFKNFMFL
jgi:hypothetical protein